MKKLAKIGTCTALVGTMVIGGAVAANAHGFVGNSKSDVQSRVALKDNGDMGPIQSEPQSIEGPKGFSLDASTGGPADGNLASAGLSMAAALDAQSPDRWVENEVSAGETINIGWEYTAPHKTSQWHYYITKNGWDQNSPLTRAELEPLTTIGHDGTAAPQDTAHQVKLPADHTGDHVIYAVWDVADTTNAFYNVIDVHIDGDAAPEVPDTVAPSAPANVDSTKVTDTTVDLVWEAATDNVGVVRYEIQRAVKGGEFQKVGTATDASFADKDLAAGTAYDYRVVAVDGAENASSAGTFSVTTKDEAAAPGTDTEAPTSPADVHSMETTADTVDLMWSESTDDVGVDSYEIQRAVKGGEFQKVGSTDKTSHLDTGLKASTSYEYKVIASDAAGNESAASETFTVTTKDGSAPDPVDPTVKAWDANAAYNKGDRVSHNGSIFEAVQSYQGNGDTGWINALNLWKKVG